MQHMHGTTKATDMQAVAAQLKHAARVLSQTSGSPCFQLGKARLLQIALALLGRCSHNVSQLGNVVANSQLQRSEAKTVGRFNACAFEHEGAYGFCVATRNSEVQRGPAFLSGGVCISAAVHNGSNYSVALRLIMMSKHVQIEW